MRLKFRNLGSNEFFCCTKSDVKRIFGEDNVSISFSFISKTYTVSGIREEKNIKGIVIASASVSTKKCKFYHNPSVNFYKYYSDDMELKKSINSQFQNEYLPKIRDFINNNKNDEIREGSYYFLVELYNNSLRTHEFFFIE